MVCAVAMAKWSAANTMLGVVGLDASVVLNPLVVLDQLGRDAIGQVSRHMIEDSGLEVPDPYEDLEICDCKTVRSEVPATMCFEPLLQPREIEGERPFDQRFALGFLFLFGKEKGCRELGVDVLHRLHSLVA